MRAAPKSGGGGTPPAAMPAMPGTVQAAPPVQAADKKYQKRQEATHEMNVGAGSVQASVFAWEDGRFGGTFTATFPLGTEVTPEMRAEAQAANNFAVESLRGLMEALARSKAAKA